MLMLASFQITAYIQALNLVSTLVTDFARVTASFYETISIFGYFAVLPSSRVEVAGVRFHPCSAQVDDLALACLILLADIKFTLYMAHVNFDCVCGAVTDSFVELLHFFSGSLDRTEFLPWFPTCFLHFVSLLPNHFCGMVFTIIMDFTECQSRNEVNL